MRLKLFLTCFVFILTLNAKECSPYYNPERFYDANENLIELIKNNITDKGFEFFEESQTFKKLAFKKESDYYISTDKHIRLNEYIYPVTKGIWKYKKQNEQIDEINIAQIELYRYKDAEIAEELNQSYGEFWSDWIEDGYEMKLIPEQTLFRYNDKYFTFSVYVYGFIGDATLLKGTIINYWFKDYTKHVNKYIQCKKEKNDS